MRKLLQKLKNNRGATLIELIVGMIISVIVLAAASAVMAPMMRVFMKSNELAEMNLLLETLSGYIIADMNRATDDIVENSGVIEITTGVEVIEYAINVDGVLERNGAAVLDAGFYKGKKLDENMAFTPGYTFTLTVLDRNGDEMASREFAVNPLGIP